VIVKSWVRASMASVDVPPAQALASLLLMGRGRIRAEVAVPVAPSGTPTETDSLDSPMFVVDFRLPVAATVAVRGGDHADSATVEPAVVSTCSGWACPLQRRLDIKGIAEACS
jgi:hypothetical protein